MTKRTIRRSMAFRHDSINSTSSPGNAIEDFDITYDDNPGNVAINATRTRDMLSVRFELPGFKYDAKRNRLRKPRASSDATIVPAYIAQQIQRLSNDGDAAGIATWRTIAERFDQHNCQSSTN